MYKKLFTLAYLSVLLWVLLSGCDKIETQDGVYFTKDTAKVFQPDTDTIQITKKVLLMEFTGIRCVNCPDAHEVIHQIQTAYPGRFLAVSFHGTSLARPIGGFSGQPDLRTPEGNDIISAFDISAIPVGMTDYFDKNHLSYKEDWTAQASQFINEKPAIGFEINNCYCENNLKSIINVKTYDNLSGDYKICVYIVEDSIITKQESNEGIIENYIQKNVFRKSLTNVWGDLLFTGETNSGTVATLTYTLQIPADWKPENCRIICFVFRDEDKKILNSDTKPLKE